MAYKAITQPGGQHAAQPESTTQTHGTASPDERPWPPPRGEFQGPLPGDSDIHDPVRDAISTHVATLEHTRISRTAKLLRQRYYNPSIGKFRAIVIGTRVWFNDVDVARFTGLNLKVITQIADPSQIVRIPNAALANPDNQSGIDTYLLFETVQNFLNLKNHGSYVLDLLKSWVSRDLLDPAYQIKSGACVLATTLHRMLGAHLEFEWWVDEMRHKFNLLGDYCYPVVFLNDDEDLGIPVFGDGVPGDFKIPLTVARDFARHIGDCAGRITYLLLRDGGYFHNGPLGETPDATLDRFQGLIPDRSGRVQARKVHEFISGSGPFDAWVERFKKEDPSNMYRFDLDASWISLDEADRRGLWGDGFEF